MLLEGKLALITGGGSGIGEGIAHAMAKHGARVIVADKDPAAAKRVAGSIGDTAADFALDVANRADCDALAEQIAHAHGAIAILVNNAGIIRRGKLEADTARADWDATMAVNLEGPYNMVTAFLDQLKTTQGSVINIGSIQSFIALPNSAAYTASKGGVRALTKALAIELSPQGVRVNAIAPGMDCYPAERRCPPEPRLHGKLCTTHSARPTRRTGRHRRASRLPCLRPRPLHHRREFASGWRLPGLLTVNRVRTSVLDIGFLESGPKDGPAVILLHGWPSDVHDYDEVAPPLAKAGFRVLTPWLRGFGPTRFLDAKTPRSGQQAALGADLRDFIDALSIESAILVGYDWGGRAACVAAALWPERVNALVAITGYGIQNIATAVRPASAEHEYRYWYQWYFHTDRGRNGLTVSRNELARLLWRLWSPNWDFDDATFQATADSFGNPDFVDVTIQSYRHRYGNAPGDPAFKHLEAALAALPPINVPTIVLHGEADGVGPPAGSIPRDRLFTGRMERRLIPRAGHFLPRESPQDVVAAVMRLAVSK